MEVFKDTDEAESFFSTPVQDLYDTLCKQHGDRDDSILLKLFDDEGLLKWDAVAELMPGKFSTVL